MNDPIVEESERTKQTGLRLTPGDTTYYLFLFSLKLYCTSSLPPLKSLRTFLVLSILTLILYKLSTTIIKIIYFKKSSLYKKKHWTPRTSHKTTTWKITLKRYLSVYSSYNVQGYCIVRFPWRQCKCKETFLTSQEG